MKKYLLLIFSVGYLFYSQAQNPNTFDQEIAKFSELSIPKNEEITVFTGSSSIRFWKDLAIDCNSSYTINTGFGGSQMSDLLYFIDETVIRFQPSKVYIYEGDNDIVALKSTKEILKTTRQIVNTLKEKLPTIEIILIGAKPSPSRWEFKNQYLALNDAFKSYANITKQVSYIDVWAVMLNEQGFPKSSIFISDSLHMNRKGYLIWKNQICNQ